MNKIIELVIAVVILVAAIVLTVNSSDGNGGGGNLPASNNRYVQMVRGSYDDSAPHITYGEAFDDFFGNPRWTHFKSTDGKDIVEFTGDFMYDGQPASAVIQFTVDGDGGRFEVTGYEVDGDPQTLSELWGLLSTVFGETGNVGSSAGQQQTVGDRIMIGETQIIDHTGFGNFEVTLEYVEFIDGIDEAIFPDEGNVFLNVVLTLRNIGTESGSLMTRNTAVYDDIYEFEERWSDGVFSVNPLSPPATGSIVFMLPNTVVESSRSLVINFDDYSGDVVSFVIRPGTAVDGSGSANAANEYPGEVLYNGIPVTRFLEYSLSDLLAELGAPSEIQPDPYGGYANYYIYDDDDIYFTVYQTDVIEVSGVPQAFEIDGVTLNKNREELIRILGEPVNEEWDEMDERHYIYFITTCWIEVKMLSQYDEAPYTIRFFHA
jgi:hypothetical protein